jgi:3-polyprenyl-4-hydroxybenzoate decarboxylase and related decarboxylases
MDLRGFIDRLLTDGRLRRVTELTDWRFEVGQIIREERTPLLFENIKDYPGQRLFSNGLVDSSSIGIALGLHPGMPGNAIRTARKRALTPIAPLIVRSGAVLDNVVDGEAIDFLKFPIPHWHREDVARYLGTWHLNITKDPENGSRNLGVYRMQVLGPRRATVSTSPRSHLALHLAKAEREGRPLEMAVAIGVGEALIMAASASCPFGTDEYGLAGALQSEAVRLIQCKTISQEVPGDSEIVIEGLIQPGVRVQDGPYFDYAGKPSTNRNAFLFEATRVMFRNNPIFRGTSIGNPGAEDHQLFAFLADLNLVDFHGSQPKQWVQNQFLKMRMFKPFQFAGRGGSLIRRRTN